MHRPTGSNTANLLGSLHSTELCIVNGCPWSSFQLHRDLCYGCRVWVCLANGTVSVFTPLNVMYTLDLLQRSLPLCGRAAAAKVARRNSRM